MALRLDWAYRSGIICQVETKMSTPVGRSQAFVEAFPPCPLGAGRLGRWRPWTYYGKDPKNLAAPVGGENGSDNPGCGQAQSGAKIALLILGEWHDAHQM